MNQKEAASAAFFMPAYPADFTSIIVSNHGTDILRAY
jgi:anaerobic C4-dicarboxylate transporter